MIVQLGSAVPRGYLFWDEQWRLADDATVVATSACDTYLPPVLWDDAAVTRTALAKCSLSTLKHLLGCVEIPAPTPKDWVVLHHCALKSAAFVSSAGNLHCVVDGISSWLRACSILRALHAAVTKQAPPLFCTDSNVLAEVDFVAQTGLYLCGNRGELDSIHCKMEVQLPLSTLNQIT